MASNETPAEKPADKPAAAENPPADKPAVQPSHISVSFTIVTPDQLRRILFSLTKVSDQNSESWGVMFQLDERAEESKPFQLIIKLQVDVAHGDAAKAAATAKHGMDTDQHAQALVAADTAKDAVTGDATKEDAKEDAQAVVGARNPASPS